ncbi:hypothetical protein VNO78_23845 [Psophocarpus tetragonolobus]|uniref:Reverse transcriptase zinc-binding domain-containing protein n=1 Tax=Psophocarpus tetragonolobus TaxID=3891 RepID=A0AAN9S3R5_PSOTE
MLPRSFFLSTLSIPTSQTGFQVFQVMLFMALLYKCCYSYWFGVYCSVDNGTDHGKGRWIRLDEPVSGSAVFDSDWLFKRDCSLLGPMSPLGYEANAAKEHRGRKEMKWMANRPQWRWLWSLQIPQRCKTFVWLTLNDRVPDVGFSPCPYCAAQETLIHVLRDCPRATSVWVNLVAHQHQRAFFSCSLWSWMVTYLQHPWSSVNSDDRDAVLFAATAWLLWKDRKCWVCGGCSLSSERVVHRVGALADDYGRFVEMEHSAPTPALRYVSWCFYWNQPPSQLQLRSVADTSNVVSPSPKL